jgi:AhpD family alkylhydroperoxidase
MAEGTIGKFREEREQLNRVVMKYSGLSIERFHSLDAQVYRQGALPTKTKELLGLVASPVLRCDDCIKYHIIRWYEEDVTSEELKEALAISLVVGESIAIPHLRRAFQAWDELQQPDRS